MILDIISWVSVGLILISVSTLILHNDWRVNLGALAVQYMAAFWLVTRHLPIAMGSVKLIAGWMVVASLGMTRLGLLSLEDTESNIWPGGQWFKAAMIGVVAVITAGVTFRIEAAIPGMGLPVIAGGILLVGTGVVHLGLTSDLMRVTLGLLTMLMGFEILYAAVESSILVTGLLAVINLGIGIAGSYLMAAGSVPLDPIEDPS